MPRGRPLGVKQHHRGGNLARLEEEGSRVKLRQKEGERKTGYSRPDLLSSKEKGREMNGSFERGGK